MRGILILHLTDGTQGQKEDNNGEIKYSGVFENGNQQGKWKWYYENGKTEIEGVYDDGEKDDKWIYYDKNSQIKRIDTFKDGKLTTTREY